VNEPYLPGPERRRRILDGAKRVFAARGYHDTNISHICDDLGIARGTLYQYFRSKQDVFTAVIEELLDRVRRFVATAPPLPEMPPGVRPTEDQAIAYSARCLRSMLGAVFEDEASLRILVREAGGPDVHVDGILRSIDAIIVDRVAGDVAAAQRMGIIRADVDARRAALFTMGGVQKLALAVLAAEGKVDLDALALEATRMHLVGLLDHEIRGSGGAGAPRGEETAP
jgi:AcrR family transcriptional regulator